MSSTLTFVRVDCLTRYQVEDVDEAESKEKKTKKIKEVCMKP